MWYNCCGVTVQSSEVFKLRSWGGDYTILACINGIAGGTDGEVVPLPLSIGISIFVCGAESVSLGGVDKEIATEVGGVAGADLVW